MAVLIPESHLDLFQKKSLAYLATHLKDGTIQVTPVWCGHEDGHVVINSAKGRQKDVNMRRNPNVALCVADPDNPFRYLEVRGRVVEITEDGADAMIDRLSQRYLGVDSYPNRTADEVRVIYRIEPQKILANG